MPERNSETNKQSHIVQSASFPQAQAEPLASPTRRHQHVTDVSGRHHDRSVGGDEDAHAVLLDQSRSTPLLDALRRLELAVASIHDSDTFRRYLDVQARFHKYSWRNAALILAQRQQATQVAGYATWRDLGRVVRRGEHGIRILVPLPRRIDVATDAVSPGDAAGGEVAKPPQVRLSFGVGTVFDIAQTDGPPLPRVEVPVLSGQDGQALFGRLESLAKAEGLSVGEAGSELTGLMGYYAADRREIVIRRAPQLQMTKTLAHELAHHYVGARYSTAEDETIAEAVAYVVCAHYGLDTGERSFPYVATWSREPKTLKGALTHIQRVASRMIEQVDGTVSPPANQQTSGASITP